MVHAERAWATAAALAVCIMAIAGCRQTIYQPLDAANADSPDLDRRVGYRLDHAYLSHAPRCAAIYVVPAKANPRVVTAITGAAERHLATRLPRVMGAATARMTADRLGVDLKTARSQRQFALQTRCYGILSVRLLAVADSFWGVWANREIGVELKLVRIGDQPRELWAARHIAGRSDGGVPLSLISLPFSVGRAAMLAHDEEAFQSIADDAVRRMMVTLPDIRNAFPPIGTGSGAASPASGTWPRSG